MAAPRGVQGERGLSRLEAAYKSSESAASRSLIMGSPRLQGVRGAVVLQGPARQAFCGLSDGIERSVNGARIGTLWEARGRLLRLFEPTKREWNCSERRWRAFRREPAQERSV